jgi:hypothetical protein
LDIAGEDFDAMLKWKYFEEAFEVYYDKLLIALREASKECGFQRSICVHSGIFVAAGPDTVRDLHLAFGGRMICDGKLEWDNYKRVG